MHAEPSTCRLEAAIDALADRQHGVVGRAQLAELGLGRGAIGHRLKVGRLRPVHRGVFAVGGRRLSGKGRWVAACLAFGVRTALSHRSAAALWGIRRTAASFVELTAPGRPESRAGIKVYRAIVPADERTLVDSIPVTTSARTLLDLATVLTPHQLERALEQAEVMRLTDPLSLPQLLARYPGRHGTPALRAILARGRIGATVTRSELEERFLAFIADRHLPRPALNVPLGQGETRIEVDCMWRSPRVIVELDGRASHATGPAFERDRLRDRRLQAAGWRVVRVTWRQLHAAPNALASDLRALLARD